MKGDLRDLTPVNADIAGDLARAVGAAAPRASGALAASFEGTGTPGGAEVSSELNYAGPQNYGVPAHNIAATHYAENTLAAAEPAANAKYQAGIAKLVRKAET